MLLNTKYVFWFYLQRLSEAFLILKGTERDIIIVVYWSPCKVPVILVTFNETWIFWADFRKILKYKISWKSVQWEQSCSMLTDGHNEVNSRFSQLRERAQQTKWKTYSLLLDLCCFHLQFLSRTDFKSNYGNTVQNIGVWPFRPKCWLLLYAQILRSVHTVNLCVLFGYQNKQRLFPYTELTDWFL